ncbi:hypothetical protein [Streptomyces sp. SLBN-134]|uniref:hypothetical protein n=1 Tax=Streptomyces sp. SLBN-134 TaxID=2768456 RepID=UPI0021B3E774|nr:hypothetical protein [Streptomyces sp. SLBN-134]
MSDKYSPRTPEERLIVDALLHDAMSQADALPRPATVRAALCDVAKGELLSSSPIDEVLHDGGQGAALLYEFDATLMRALNEARTNVGTPSDLPVRKTAADNLTRSGPPRRAPRANPEPSTVHRAPDDVRGRLTNLRRGVRRSRGEEYVERAEEALERQSKAEIVNEILAGGAIAASVTAAASVAKAKIEATTQRRKNDLDAETERLRIASEERIAGIQAMRAQVETEGSELDGA